MRETVCCLRQIIIKLILLKLNSTSRYLDDLLNIDNPYFEQMVGPGLENCTRPLVFTSGSSVRASGNCHLLARQDE